jgi:hypothetical protein
MFRSKIGCHILFITGSARPETNVTNMLSQTASLPNQETCSNSILWCHFNTIQDSSARSTALSPLRINISAPEIVAVGSFFAIW